MNVAHQVVKILQVEVASKPAVLLSSLAIKLTHTYVHFMICVICDNIEPVFMKFYNTYVYSNEEYVDVM